MNFHRYKVRIAHLRFRLVIFGGLLVHGLLTFLETGVIPVLLVGSLVLVGFVLWQSKQWYAAAGQITEIGEHIRSKNEIMRTLAQMLGGAFLLTGLYFTAKNVFVSRRAQITDRFSDALEKLSETGNLFRRIGGIHTLESIARDSPKDHSQIMEILTNFVRLNTMNNAGSAGSSDQSSPGKAGPRDDVRQALNAIGRRRRRFGRGESRPLDLTGTNLDGADLKGANLERVNFQGASLVGAMLQGAHLKGADFSRARLEGANLTSSDLTNTNFYKADLPRAQFRDALLARTSFAKAQMQGASFDDTSLYDVIFDNSALDGASFEGACLKRCLFFEASNRGTNWGGARLISPKGLERDRA